MVGLIWFVQLVHYPLFGDVGEAEYARYHQAHVARTGLAVGPAMIAEAMSALWIAVAMPGVNPQLAWTGLFLVMFVWLVTALFSVPAHGRLSDSFDGEVHRKLVSTNWLRTIGWSVRGVIALLLMQG